jgi:uncharacterized protein YcnI
MANRPKLVLRSLTLLLTTAIGLLALGAPASARVSIVPDQTTGGGTQTFAFRLANERSDTTSNRLEITFPQDLPIAYVEVAPTPGWTAKVNPRPLNPPVKVGDKVVSQVADSIVLEGGAVLPHQFEQFLITMGPLPADGRLLLQTTQGFANGQSERLTTAQVPGARTPGAPVISMGTATAEAQAEAAAPLPNAPDTESAIAVPGGSGQTTSGGGGLPSLTVLWVALGAAALIIAGVWFQARRRARRPSTPDGPGPDIFDDGVTAPEPEAAGDAGPADSTEVASK